MKKKNDQVWRVLTSHAKTMGVVKTQDKNTSVSVTLVSIFIVLEQELSLLVDLV